MATIALKAIGWNKREGIRHDIGQQKVNRNKRGHVLLNDDSNDNATNQWYDLLNEEQ